MKNLNKKNFEILDCTLRDGGYYNNWDFSKSVIQSYLYKTYSTGIRYVELGFRFNDMSSKKGLTAYTKKSLISSLNIPLDLNVGVMINVGDLIQNNKLQINVLKNLINKDNIKRINFIRFACHQNEIFYLTKCFKYLKKLKLKIFVNIMQISEITSLNLKKILTFLNKNQIDNIYIADSLGSLHKKQLKKIIIILNKHWKGVYLTKCFKYLKKLKLKIFVNIMQISEITSLNLKKILTFLNKNQIDNIYIADSLGSLHKKQLKKIIIILNKHWKGELGIHAHDNLNLALKNSLIAIANDFKWIDSTITGMGRGPGNLKTEEILKYSKKYKSSNDFLKLKNYFLKQKKIYKWGTNKYYKFAALKKIHPTYIQKILSDKRYSVKEYNKILISLSKLDTRKFNPYKLANSANFISTKSIGTWSPKSILKNKNVLILGPGKNLKLNKRKIENTIKKQKLFVIS